MTVPDDFASRLLIQAATGIGGALLGAGVPFIKDWFTKPRLSLDVDPSFRYEDIAYGPNGIQRYFKLRVTNAGRQTAKKCRVLLVKILRVDGAAYRPTGYGDAIELQWSNTFLSEQLPRVVERDLLHDIDSYHVDLCRIDSIKNQIGLMFGTNSKTKEVLQNEPPGEFILKLQVGAANSATTSQTVRLKWNGNWSDLTLEAIND